MAQSGRMIPGQQRPTSTTSPMTNTYIQRSQQTPYTPGQIRKEPWDVPTPARSADDTYINRPIGGSGSPYPREHHQRRRQILPEKYDGTSVELREYLNQFSILAELNDWDDEEKGLYLASSLTGAARGILNDMTPVERKSFGSLKQKLQ